VVDISESFFLPDTFPVAVAIKKETRWILFRGLFYFIIIIYLFLLIGFIILYLSFLVFHYLGGQIVTLSSVLYC
jgi:hypothetical protein